MFAGESRHGLDWLVGRHGEVPAEHVQFVGECGDGGDDLAFTVRARGVEQAAVQDVDRKHFGVVDGGVRPREIVFERQVAPEPDHRPSHGVVFMASNQARALVSE